jgi:hypothetical protein
VTPRQLLGALLALGVGLGVYFLFPRERLSPEEEIRLMVATMTKAAGEKDVRGVMRNLDEHFRGAGGEERRDVKQIVVGQFFRANSIVVLNPFLEVSVTNATTGHFKGTFLFAKDGPAEQGSKYEIEADVQRGDEGWRIVAAGWR